MIVLKFPSGPQWFPRRKFLRSQTKELYWYLSVPHAQRGQWDDSSIMIVIYSVIMEVILVALLPVYI